MSEDHNQHSTKNHRGQAPSHGQRERRSGRATASLRPPLDDHPNDTTKTAPNGSGSASGIPGKKDAQIGASLGINTNKAAQAQNQASKNLSESDCLPASLPRDVVRHALLAAARDLLLKDFFQKRAKEEIDELRGDGRPERTVGCYRWLRPEAGGVDLLHFPDFMAGGVRGVITCGSVWACPPCSAKITERRRRDLTEAVEGSGYNVVGLALTLQHHDDETCAEVWDRMGEAGYNLTDGRGWRGDKRRGEPGLTGRFHIVGYSRSQEVTVGENGWHVHQHLVLLIDGEIDGDELQAALRQRYTGIVEGLGGYAAEDYGLVVTMGTPQDVMTDYIAKAGLEAVDLRQDADGWTVFHELTKAGSKRGKQGGRTPLQLLADYLTGDQQAGRLWLEYYWASKGKRQLTHAGVMRKLLGALADKSDEEIEGEQEETAVILARLSFEQWQVVLGNAAVGELIHVLASGDRRELLAFLLKIGVYSHPDVGPTPELFNYDLSRGEYLKRKRQLPAGSKAWRKFGFTAESDEDRCLVGGGPHRQR